MHRSPVALALALLVLVALAPASLAAPYAVSTNDDVAVPTQTVEIDGSSYQIDAVGDVPQGEEMTVSVSVDGEEDWVVDLYNEDEQIEDWADGTGDGTATFDTSNLEPGTYALALEVDGKTQQVHPVVVSAYDLSLSAPSEIAPGEPLEVTVDVGESVAADETVEVGIHTDGTELQAQASANGDGTYTATLSPEETGEYALYAAVRAEGKAGGYPVSTGIANGQVVTVTESDGSDGGDGSGSDDGSGDDGSGSSDGSADDGGNTDDGGSADDGTSSDDGGDGDGSADTDGGSTDDGAGDDSADGNGSDDGGAAAPPEDGDETDGDGDSEDGESGDAATDGASDDGDGDETDTDASDDGPMEPNESAETDSDDGDGGDGDDELAVGWLIPLVALCMVALLGLARRDRSP